MSPKETIGETFQSSQFRPSLRLLHYGSRRNSTFENTDWWVRLWRFLGLACNAWSTKLHDMWDWHHVDFVLAPSPMHHRTTYFGSLTDAAREDLSQSVSRLKTAVLNDNIVLLWEIWSGSSYNRTATVCFGPISFRVHHVLRLRFWPQIGVDFNVSQCSKARFMDDWSNTIVLYYPVTTPLRIVTIHGQSLWSNQYL